MSEKQPQRAANIVTVPLEYYTFAGSVAHGEIEISKERLDDVQAFFAAAWQQQFPFEQVVIAKGAPFNGDDEALMAANATSGYNQRPIAGTNTLSKHAQGDAFDVNPRLNPYIRLVAGKPLASPVGARWDPAIAGTLHARHPLVELMKAHGWEWGGDWDLAQRGVVDYQHFEWPTPD